MRKGPRFSTGYNVDKYIPVQQSAETTIKTSRKRPRDRDGYNPNDYIPVTDTVGAQSSFQTPGPSNSALHHISSGKRRKLSHVACPGPAYPLSAYQVNNSPPSVSSEQDALKTLLKIHDKLHAQDLEPPEYTYCELSQFSIYRPNDSKGNARYRGELVTLDRLLRHGDGCDTYVFDGVLSCGEQQHKVQGVHFGILAIDGYGEDSMEPDVTRSITIRSKLANHIDVWYRLGVPSAVYSRFYEPFLWLVQFAKFFVNYLLKEQAVTLDHFKRDGDFLRFIRTTYEPDRRFSRWHAKCGKLDDFRTSVAANIGFLHKECYSIDSTKLGGHPIWHEVDPLRLKAIPARESVYTDTIVTPFVRRCFQDMYFARKLQGFPVSDLELHAKVQRLKAERGLTPWSHSSRDDVPSLPTPQSLSPERASSPGPLDVRAGDVVAVEPDTDGHWKTADDVWYVYVQQVRAHEKSGETVLDVLWLYRPADTTLEAAAASYPFPTELFLSDNCSCGAAAIPMSSVLAKVKVAWNISDPFSATTLFVRRKFRTVHEEDHYSFETINELDWNCSCSRKTSAWDKCLAQYHRGDTVLTLMANNPLSAHTFSPVEDNDSGFELDTDVSHGSANLLEPAQIVDFDHPRRTILLRLFVRESLRDPAARKNELALSDVYLKAIPSNIIRKCHVLALGFEEDIPTPYDRDGAGDCFFMRLEYDECDEEDASASPNLDSESINWGWNPRKLQPKLRGLGIFCGGGNFDRGLEEGGAVDFKYAVDWAEHALHSYRANARHADTKYYLGSVDDYLASAIQGTACEDVARIGDVDIISAGSPCPGFSDLQTDKYSEQSLKNASMVASVLSYVDLYVPTYLILENVVSMTRNMGVDKKQNVFSQMLATLVAMGYQVQQFLIDSWTVGSSEQRSRLFIVSSAPGAQPLPTPPHTHDHPAAIEFRVRSLGKCTNGLPFGTRRNFWTPFPCTTIGDACTDLPGIGDAQVQLCPAFPDHRPSAYESGASRSRTALIPVHPAGQSLALAVASGYISGGEPHAYFQSLGPLGKTVGSKSFARVFADRLVPTVITVLCPRCAKTGRVLHWNEHRVLTVMECRRAQGFPDDEVLIGSPAQQMRIIGNSVNRFVALAMGMALREAWTTTMARKLLIAPQRAEPQSSMETSMDTEESAQPRKERTAFVLLPSRSESRPKTPPSPKHPQEGGSKSSPVRLSPEQIESIRQHGFKGILHMLNTHERLGGEAE